MSISHAGQKIKEDKNISSFLIASKLGDGGFVKKDDGYNRNAYIVFKHSEKQLGYLKWKMSFLNRYGLIKDTQKIKIVKTKLDKKEFILYKFSTICHPILNKYANSSIEDFSKINNLGFAVWILDDGNIYKKSCKISCPKFSEKQLIYVCDIIEKNFNIKFYPYIHGTNSSKNYIRSRSGEYEKIKNIVHKIIGKIDIFINKFSE